MKKLFEAKANIIYVIILFLIIYPNVVISQNLDKVQQLRINPAISFGGTASKYINKLNFICLENTKQSAFGSIDQLEIAKQHFIILDRETNAIIIFTKAGKFHAKILGVKVDIDVKLFNFYFDNRMNEIEIPFYMGSFIYNIDGKLIKKNINKKNNDLMSGEKTLLGNKFTGYNNYETNRNLSKDSIAYELVVFDGIVNVQKCLPYSVKYANLESNEIIFNQNSLSFYKDFELNDTAVYYLRPYDYNVYRLTAHTFEIAYQFIFPLQNSLPKNFKSDSSFNRKRKQYIMQNSNIIKSLSNFYKKEDLFFFNADLSYLYNIKSQNLICINRIISDSNSYFLPITDAEVGGVDFSNHGIINFDGTNFYTSYPSSVLFNQMEATKNKRPKYSPELVKYFSNPKNKRGNPVLVQIQFKPNL